MALITRSEAAYRLKLISARINNAVSACRDGSWKGAASEAEEAMKELERIMPHLDEAAETDSTFGIFQGTPPASRVSINDPTMHGGMGYRGSHRKKDKSNPAPPKPITIPVSPVAQVADAPPRPGIPRPNFPPQADRGPIITPPPPIITPPPPIPIPPKPAARVLSIETLDLSEGQPSTEFTFDIRKMDHYMQGKEPEVLSAFCQLDEPARKQVITLSTKTGQPVKVRVKVQ